MINELQLFMTRNLIFTMIGIFLVSMLLTSIFTALLIPVLRKNKAKQTIHEDVPQAHHDKSGTPTMGGIAIVVGVVITCFAAALYQGISQNDIITTLAAFTVFALLGFLDDYNKVIKKRNLGLTAKQKILVQCLISLVVAVIFVVFEDNPKSIVLPFFDTEINMGLWYIPFMIFAIVAMVNSVNLTDGLDGLAAGVSLVVCIFFAFASVTYSIVSSNWFFLALAGACAGFLIFNKNPAKIFMGDTGSMAIGGGIAVAAFYSDMEIIMIIAGFVYVVEALSDIVQVASYKLRNGKRILKMAPLHHHFELLGWSEKHIVAVFVLSTFILCIFSSFFV